jgi:hypothetical protein
MVEATRDCMAAADRGASISGNRSTIVSVISPFEFLITTTTTNYKQHVRMMYQNVLTLAMLL